MLTLLLITLGLIFVAYLVGGVVVIVRFGGGWFDALIWPFVLIAAWLFANRD